MNKTRRDEDTSLDVLESEDRLLLEFFEKVKRNEGPDVEERYEYGSAAKQIVHHLAIRQSSLMDVARTIKGVPELRASAERMREQATSVHDQIDHLDDLSRSVQGISLNTGQDFDGPLRSLMEVVGKEIAWELQEAIPAVRSALGPDLATAGFKSGHYVRTHVPTGLHVGDPRWFERHALLARIVTLFDFLRDHPRAPRGERRRT